MIEVRGFTAGACSCGRASGDDGGCGCAAGKGPAGACPLAPAGQLVPINPNVPAAMQIRSCLEFMVTISSAHCFSCAAFAIYSRLACRKFLRGLT